MGSTRFPGKVLEDLAGKPVLARVIERTASATTIDEVVVVTSDTPRDDVLVELCLREGWRCMRGSEYDVLDRFRFVAEQLRPHAVVRITADCPLIDPGVIDRLVDLFRAKSSLQYACVATGARKARRGFKRFPHGLDAEIMTIGALESAAAEATEQYEREHVTPFLWRRPDQFPATFLQADRDVGYERWTVDTPADLELVRAIYERVESPDSVFGWQEAIAVLEREPALRCLNQCPKKPDSLYAAHRQGI